jgi:diacylglycerol kinase family enzyme
MAEAASATSSGTGKRRALLIVNRKARTGLRSLDLAMAVLEAGNIDLVEIELASREQVLGEICEDAANVDLVILGGGDGTLNAAAPALVQTGLPLGILPLGTANDLARTLGLPGTPEGAAHVIAAGHTRAIDLGEVNGIVYFNVASIGFSATLARRLTAEAKRKWGVGGYALAAARLLAKAGRSVSRSTTTARRTAPAHCRFLSATVVIMAAGWQWPSKPRPTTGVWTFTASKCRTGRISSRSRPRYGAALRAGRVCRHLQHHGTQPCAHGAARRECRRELVTTTPATFRVRRRPSRYSCRMKPDRNKRRNLPSATTAGSAGGRRIVRR